MQLLEARALETIPRIVHGFSTRIGGASKLGKESALNLGFTDWDKRAAVEKNRKVICSSAGRRQNANGRAETNSFGCNSPNRLRSHKKHCAVTRLSPIRRASCSRCKQPTASQFCWPTNAVARSPQFTRAGEAQSPALSRKQLAECRWNLARKPADILAAIGPAIGQCSYEVGSDVAKQFASQFGEAREWFDGPYERVIDDDAPNPLKWLLMTPPGHDPPLPTVNLDLIAANRWQLKDAGVPEKNISAANLCTACNTKFVFQLPPRIRRHRPADGGNRNYGVAKTLILSPRKQDSALGRAAALRFEVCEAIAAPARIDRW